MPPRKIEYPVDAGGLMLGRKLHVGLCSDPACRCVHMLFADEHDKPFAMVALSVEQVANVMGDLRQYAAEIQIRKLTGKGPPQ